MLRWYVCINNIIFDILIMALIRFILSWFYKDNKLEDNLKEWDDNFVKGKLKKGRRFR